MASHKPIAKGPAGPAGARGPRLRRTEDERRWLEALARRVRDLLSDSPVASQFGMSKARGEPTADASDGWYVCVGKVRGTAASYYVFVDNSLGDHRRALWYGAWAASKTGIEWIAELGSERWPYTQWWVDDTPPAGFRYDDPWLQRYGAGEYYYGWFETEPPNTSRAAAEGLVTRIAERFAALLAEPPDRDGANILDRLDELDARRLAKARLEQAVLRRLLLKRRPSADCALCDEHFDVEFLVAAHIKRRADCNDAERRDHKHNLMALCSFGCDALFEHGYVAVRGGGRIVAGSRKATTEAVAARVETLAGRRCSAWSDDSAKYFVSHRARVAARARPRR